MQITRSLNITKKKSDNSFEINDGGAIITISPSDPTYEALNSFYNEIKGYTPHERENAISSGTVTVPTFGQEVNDNSNTEPAPKKMTAKEQTLRGLSKMIDFFSEFSFTPSFRFVNTLARNIGHAYDYVNNYFALTDSSYVNEVNEKMKSTEFKAILKDIKAAGIPANEVNSRFKVYYGAAGTGKTTLAQTETDNRCIVCNASMLPADLMEDFIFRDGQPDFNPSLLYNCMEQGLPIVLDEINLLPFDSLRFLQGITDGKKIVTYKNREIHIKDGFQIIGTMNLTLGGATYGLPEPLVDRCFEIREFKLTAEQLLSAIMEDE